MRYGMHVYGIPDADGHHFHCLVVENLTGDPNAFDAVLTWVREAFGDGPVTKASGQQVGCRWCYSPDSWSVWLRDENDAIAFRLRWC